MNQFLLIFISVIVLVSCNQDDNPKKFQQFDGDVSLIVHQNNDLDGNKLWLKTDSYFECGSYQLVTEITPANDHVEIVILGAEEYTSLCRFPSAASAEVELSENLESVSIHYKKHVDEYSIGRSDESIFLVPITTDFTYIINQD